MTRAGFTYLSIATLSYGVLHVVDKAVLNQGIPASSYTICRVFIAFLVLAGFAFLRSRISLSFSRLKSRIKDLIIIGVLASGWGLLLQTFGLTYTSATNVSMLLTLVAPCTTLFAYFTLKEEISRTFIASSLLMLIGVWLIYMRNDFAPFGRGDIMVLAAAVGFAYSNVHARRTMADTPTTVVTLGRLAFGSLSIALLMPVLDIPILPILDAPFLVLLGGAVFGVRMLAYYKGIEHEGAAVAATFLLFSPVITVITAHLILGEALTAWILCGMGLVILGGLILVSWKRPLSTTRTRG